MPAALARYVTLAAPADLEAFDTALGAIVSDRLAGRVTPAEAVALEHDVRTLREEHLMRHGG
jgi:hypothetical protein